jgi:Protein of unknown function (DUF3551)
MRALILGLAILPAAIAFMPRPSAAIVWYPWCSTEFGSMSPENCYHRTKAQCEATVSGLGGRCYQNPARPSGEAAEPRLRRRHAG